MTVTEQGYNAPRGNDFLELMVDEIETLFNVSIPRTSDNATYQLLVVMAARLGELSEATQALYDLRDSNNATGSHLRNNGALVGVYPLPATRSEVVLTLTGIAGTIVPAGVEIRDAQGQTWELTQAVTIPGEGLAQAQTFGAVRGFSGTITEIVTPVNGWEAVTNDSDAQLGREEETDQEFRLRRAQDLGVTGGGSTAAIQARLVQELNFINRVKAIDNETNINKTVSVYTIPPGGLLLSVDPEPQLLSNIDALAVKIWELTISGTELVGQAERDIIAADGQTKRVRWHNALAEIIPVDITLTLAPGFGLSDYQQDVEEITKNYFASLGLGATARRLQLAGLIARLEGIIGVDILFDNFAGDYTPSEIDFIFPFPVEVSE
jgi:hypothetical protein